MPDIELSQPLLYSIARSARTLGVSEDTVRRMIARGELPAVRIGSRVLVPARALTDVASAR